MVYNGFLADFVFNTCVMTVWCVFLWRVLDGPRFSWWVTALLTLGISAAYLVPVLTLTTAGSVQRLLLFPTGPLALAFVLFYGKPLRKLLAVAVELLGSVLLEMLFSAVTVHVSDLEIDAQYSVWADPRAIVYGAVYVLLLALVLLVFSLNNTALFVATALISLAVLSVVYTLVYRATSNAYYRIVKSSV